MNGRGRKSKWLGSSMATFSAVPHLRIVFNFGGVMIPVDKLQTKWNWYRNQQERLLASPIVHARTNTTLKVMKAICTPHHDCSPNYFLKWTLRRVAIFTNPQTYSFSEWATRGYVDEPKWNTFPFPSASCSTNLVYGTEPRSLMGPDNLFSSARISLIWGWSWLSSTNVCSLIIHFDPGATRLSLHTSFLSLPFNFPAA
jgi:hypothetical protein